ncbi:cation transport protein-domain-containing protein [Gautieria morchelliformis]|nr:cation transport protein-domain-containing protein [Gautieria morchelliformis]
MVILRALGEPAKIDTQFPMHQTWFLVACLFIFRMGQAFNSRYISPPQRRAYMIRLTLDIGLSVTDTLPIGTRVVAGLFQGLAAHASGFAIVPVASLAPAIQFLYMSMMYIAVYPVAMSIRTTNVWVPRDDVTYRDFH